MIVTACIAVALCPRFGWHRKDAKRAILGDVPNGPITRACSADGGPLEDMQAAEILSGLPQRAHLKSNPRRDGAAPPLPTHYYRVCGCIVRGRAGCVDRRQLA
jgi:hypothetical protein